MVINKSIPLINSLSLMGNCPFYLRYSIFLEEENEDVLFENIKSPFQQPVFKTHGEMLRDMNGPDPNESHEAS
jgi:hypothetical protein